MLKYDFENIFEVRNNCPPLTFFEKSKISEKSEGGAIIPNIEVTISDSLVHPTHAEADMH